MAREGIIPKLRFKLSPSDFKAIEHALTSPEMRPKLNDMSDRAVQAMVDFERAQGMEKAIAKRVLFVWAWMRGGTRYPFRFALDHPFRTALIGYTVAGAPGAPERVQSKIHDTLPNVATGMPPWLAGALEAGNTTINGVKYPKVFPTRQISPVSTPWEVFQAARARPGANTFADFLNPGLASAFHVLSKQSPYGRDLPSYVDAAKQTGQRLLPQAGLVQDLISPPKGGLYPGDSSRLGRLERASRVWPIAIDPVEAEKARILNGMDSALATPEKRYRTDLAEVQKLAKDYYQNGGGKLPVEVSQDLAWRRTLDRAVDKIPKDAAGHRDPRRKAEAAARLFIRRFPSAGPTVKTDLAGSQLPVDFERIYRALRADGTTDYSRFKSDMNQASEDHLRELQHVAVAH
jgi:hypothetical protein